MEVEGEQTEGLGGRNYKETRYFFDPPDDISLEETVHSLADANTLCLVFTRARRPAGRPAPARLAEEDKWGDDWEGGRHSAATTAAGRARRLGLRGCRSISTSDSACAIGGKNGSALVCELS